MKSLIIAMAMIMLIGVQAMAFDEWTERDLERQIASTFLLLFDAYQTDIGIKNGALEYGIAKSFIGEYPTTEQIYGFFIADILLNWGVAHLLPKNYRQLFQYGTMIFVYDSISKSWGTRIVLRF